MRPDSSLSKPSMVSPVSIHITASFQFAEYMEDNDNAYKKPYQLSVVHKRLRFFAQACSAFITTAHSQMQFSILNIEL